MNDKMQEIMKKMLERLDLVVTGVLIVLLIVVGYMHLQEQSYIVPEPPTPQPRQWTVKVPIERHKENLPKPGDPTYTAPENLAQFEEVNSSFFNTDPDINNDPEARRTIIINMFDLKAVDDEALVTELNRRYNEAEAQYRANNREDAIRILDEILNQDPNHRQALELKNQLTENSGT